MTATYPDAGPAFAVEFPPVELNISKIARQVQKEYGKTVGQQMMEAIRLQAGRGKVSMGEYYAMRLFDDEALAGVDKRAFLGVQGCIKLCMKVNHPNWVVADKIALSSLMGGLGFPVVPLRAVYGNALRAGRLLRLSDRHALRDFLLDTENYPLFGKPVDAAQSKGAEGLKGVDPAEGMVETASGRKVAVDDVVATIEKHYSEGGYIFQPLIAPHEEVARLSGGRLATLRLITARMNEVHLLGAMWRIPAGENITDNFARPGNIVAEIDMDTGVVGRAARGKGLEEEVLETHPDTGERLAGFAIPCWAEALETVREGARALVDTPLIGWDVAITDEGPVLIEADPGPDMRALQTVSRRGLYDERMQGLLEWLAAEKRKRKKKGRDMKKRKAKRDLSLAVQRKAHGS